MIGYFRYIIDYIIKIEVLDDINNDSALDKEHAVHSTKLFKVLSIVIWKTGKQINNVEMFRIGHIYTIFKWYSLNEELALFNYFGATIDEEIYLKNKSGVFRKYDDYGEIKKEYFHNNGIKEGTEKIYRDGDLIEENNYIGGKLNGKSISYLNGEEKVIYYCNYMIISQ